MRDTTTREQNEWLPRARAAALLLPICLWMTAPAAAQFSSGSTGVHGAFPPLPAGMSTMPTNGQYMVWNLSTGLIRYCSAYDTDRRPDTCTTEIATAQIPGIPEGGLSASTFHFTNVNVTRNNWLHIYLVGNVNNTPLTILSQNGITLGPSIPFA